MSGANSKSGYKARYVAAASPAAPAATSRAQGSIYSTASIGFGLLEFGMYQGTGGPHAGLLRRITTSATNSGAITAAKFDDDASAALATPILTHTNSVTFGDILRPWRVDAGTGVGLWQGFHDEPIECPVGTANGIGFDPVATGLGSIEILFVWEE